MYAYLRLLLEGLLLLACVVALFWMILLKSKNNRIIHIRDASLSSEELEDHARNTAIKHSVSHKQNLLNWPIPRMNDNYNYILSVYKALNEDIQKKDIVPASAEWLLDNFYIIEEQIKVIRRDLERKAYLRLPILKSGHLKGYARIFAVVTELVSHTDGQIDDAMLQSYVKAYQSRNVLFDREIWAIPMVMKLALIEGIRHLCENIRETQKQWHKANIIVDDWLSNEGADTDKVMKLFINMLRTMDEVNPSFVEHMFYRLRRSGRSYTSVLRIVDEQLSKQGTDSSHISQKEHGSQSMNTISLGNCITTLRFFSTLDWSDLFESVSVVEDILKQDPDGTYPQMDLSTRSYYRSKVEELASRYGVSELHIAREAIALAKEACENGRPGEDGALELERTWHVGYYLVGNGMSSLVSRQKSAGRTMPVMTSMVKSHPGLLYLGAISLITLLLVAIAVQYTHLVSPLHLVLLSIIAGVGVLLPASEIAVNAVNWIVCKTLKPAVFPRLELRDGIPENLGAIVAVPTLLPDVKRVKELLKNLEGHYLGNREENLYFALIGAFKDSDSASSKGDDKIISTALDIVAKLNLKYAKNGKDIFYFFHRDSQYNEKNNKWFGWERKRGALMEFNDLVLGNTQTSFPYSSCSAPPFSNIKYIITLDSDTILPAGMARKMVGTMAHPLNRPVIDKKRGVVIEGFGLMQPRIDVDSESSNKTLFSRIFAGHEGLDPYANAISDVYQDLFGEGIFTGKGIYDLRVFQSVLKNAIPDNAILSHDLLEGSYVRTGLVTDLRLVDAYPAQYNSFAARLHRWVRGDWQLSPMLFGRILTRNHSKISNPLALLSKWKMLDNMRRSLLSPALMVLAALSFSILPGSVFFWLGFFIVALAFPFGIAVVEYVLSQHFASNRIRRHIPVIIGLKAAFLQVLMTFILLPYQAWLMVDAIIVTLARVFITKKNMLEWVTSADVEKSQKNSLKSYLSKMCAAIAEALIVAAMAVAFKPAAAVIGLFFLALWGCSPFIAFWISKESDETPFKASVEDTHELRRIARKTWRYFEEFANAKNHYLAPDNYQVDPPRGIAHRTSPTNIGLGLLAVLSARDFGYINTSKMVDLIENSVSTIESLEKWNGHLYNWYDTYTLKPLRPGYISTVDSGNLVSYLITLGQGLREILASPPVDPRFADGIRDTLLCAGKEGMAVYEACLPPAMSFDPARWSQVLNALSGVGRLDGMNRAVWKDKIEGMIAMFKKELAEFMPGIELLNSLPDILADRNDHSEIAAPMAKLLALLGKNTGLKDMPATYLEATVCIGMLTEKMKGSTASDCDDALVWLGTLKGALANAAGKIEQFIGRFKLLIDRIDALSAATVFLPLYDRKKQLFSIGYNLEESKLTNSYYDLLASEARQTSYISIARGEIPSEHWFRMGRALTVVDRYKGLVSWTGTMFEYLMPLLIMKSYKNTLLDETYSFVIKSQMKYGRQKGIPWGTSESGFNLLDINHDYQYKAIGVPWLGLKRGLVEDAVVAPYASFLALLVAPEAAVQNIARLKAEGLDGSYGFYESADYTSERLPFESKRAIVKSFMAHHQGMSLLALNNYLHLNIMQKRFGADPAMNAARLLLQEKVPSNLVFTKETKEKIVPLKGAATKEKSPVRRFTMPDAVLPRAHILSNGNYSIMITDRGTGYSKNQMVAVTRWRADSTLDPYGMFFYVRNVETDAAWSAAYGPANKLPEKYEVVFTADKAVFKRTDRQIETKTEVMVATGDNVEIRRISLKNTGETPCVLELTSYFEVVLAPQAADVAHPAFSNLFVETGFDADRKCLVANRRSRSESDKCLWIANAAVVEGEAVGDLQYETDRMQWIGRGHTVQAPAAMERSRPLSNTVGPVLDPVMSLRARVKIEPGKTAQISFLVAVSQSNEQVLSLVEKYASPDAVEKAFQLALARSRAETAYLNLEASEMELYQNMIRDILFISPMREAYQNVIMQNRRGQPALWRYGISGDLPVVLVVLGKADQMSILYEVLKAHEYWRMMDLKVDLVLLSVEEYNYALPLYALISDIVLSRQTHDIMEMPKDVFTLDRNKMPPEDISLLYAVAKVILKGDGPAMAEQAGIGLSHTLPGVRRLTGTAANHAAPAFREHELQYDNGLGGFSARGNEYVIELGKGKSTPAPWVNVIANPEFGFIASEAGSGYTWCGNSHETKLTPWSNDAVCDTPGEVVYIVDTDTGESWTPTALPIREPEPYTIRHGFGYSVFGHFSHGVEQTLTQFVPVHEAVKVSILRLKNNSQQKKHLALTYYVQPVLGVSGQDTAMHIRTSLGSSGALLMENQYNEDFAGKMCFMDASVKERSVTGDRKEFFGFGGADSPDSLKREALSGKVGTGFDPCAAIQVNITLGPNEFKDAVLLLGLATGLHEAEEITGKYRITKNAYDALADVRKFWADKMAVVQVDTPIASTNLMLDGWLQYQVISCRLWGRSGFYQSGGAFGFRDQLQDCLSIAHLWPEATRKQILLHARHQFTEGDVLHWWHEPQGKGTRTRSSDDLLWLPYVMAEYVRITGDAGILREELPFLEDRVLKESEDESYGRPAMSSFSTSLYDHCNRAVDKALRFGGHGLPLMGSGDWNDGMNTVGNKGLGESVWLGWFLATILEMLAPLCRKMEDGNRADFYDQMRAKIAEALEQHAWDGNWYRRAYFDNGMPLGSAQNTDCKIDSISQSWAVISGAGNPQRAAQAMDSLEDYLISREDGLIKLLTPAFNQGDSEPGYIKGYVPGVRENGGQYTHAAVWAIIAFAKLGDGDKAWELFELINPINHTRNLREYSRYKAEPYVMAADVYGDYPHTGRGGWSWYTGAAGWMYRAGLEHILGFQKTGDTVIMAPCIPRKWQEYTIRYQYMDTPYVVKVHNPDGLSRGVKAISTDGNRTQGNVIALVNDGKPHDVQVYMGSKDE